LITDGTNSGAIYKIAPENLLELIAEAPDSGAISKIAPQTATEIVTFLRERVTKTTETSTNPWEMMIKPLPAAKSGVSLTNKPADVMTSHTMAIKTVPLVFVELEFLTIAQPLMAGDVAGADEKSRCGTAESLSSLAGLGIG